MSVTSAIHLFSVRTVLLAIIGFMPTKGAGAVASMDCSPEDRMKMARRWINCDSVCISGLIPSHPAWGWSHSQSSCMGLVSFPGHPAWAWSHSLAILHGAGLIPSHPAWGWSHSLVILHGPGLIPWPSCMGLVSFPVILHGPGLIPSHPAWGWSHSLVMCGPDLIPSHPAWGWSHSQVILCVYIQLVTFHHQYRSLDWVCPVCGIANRNLLPQCK